MPIKFTHNVLFPTSLKLTPITQSKAALSSKNVDIQEVKMESN